jgi:hypothetical protein
MTPGVESCPFAASSPLSLPEEMCKSCVCIERLSLRLAGPLIVTSRLKYPSFFPVGGDAGTGLARLLCPLALLELFLLLPFRKRCRWKFVKLLAPGKFEPGQAPEPPKGVVTVGLLRLATCGVVRMTSSLSSGSMGSAPSSLLDESSDPSNILTLPTELETILFSDVPICDHG